MMRGFRYGLLVCLFFLAACPSLPGLQEAEERRLSALVDEIIGSKAALIGVIGPTGKTTPLFDQVFELQNRSHPGSKVVSFSAGVDDLRQMLAFVAKLWEFDVLIVVAPEGNARWPELSRRQIELWRQRPGGEESLFHIREEFLHTRGFYEFVDTLVLPKKGAVYLYRAKRQEIERLRALQRGQTPIFYGKILQIIAKTIQRPKGEEARSHVAKLLALPPAAAAPAPLLVQESSLPDGRGFRRRLLLFHDSLIGSFQAELLLPMGKTPAGAVLALHGHSDLPEDFLRRFGGHTLAQKGLVVLAPRIPASGKDGLPENNIAVLALTRGTSITALRVEQARRMLDYLSQRPEVDPDRLAVMGHSMGGALALFLGAIDLRVKAVASDQGLGLLQSLVRDNPAAGTYLPGLLSIGDWDLLHSLVRPRPLLSAPYAYPEKEKLTNFLLQHLKADALCGNEVCEAGENRKNCRSDCPPIARKTVGFLPGESKVPGRTIEQILKRLGGGSPSQSLSDALGMDILEKSAMPVTLRSEKDGEVVTIGELGFVRVSVDRGVDSPKAWVAVMDEKRRDALREGLKGEGIGIIWLDFPQESNEFEDPLKLVTASVTRVGLKAVKLRHALAALRGKEGYPPGRLPLWYAGPGCLDWVLALAVAKDLGPLICREDPFTTPYQPAVPGFADFAPGLKKELAGRLHILPAGYSVGPLLGYPVIPLNPTATPLS